MPFTYDYPRPAVTVDVVLFTMRAADLAVLLVKRKNAPFKGKWALPGGFVNAHEGLEQAAARELAEETAVTGVALEQIGAFGDPGRDPRGHTVSVAFLAFVVAESLTVEAGDDAADAKWHTVHALAADRRGKALAFDHDRILEAGRAQLQARLRDPESHRAHELVPPRFTLAELQRVYEAVYGRPFDARAFRKSVLDQGLVAPADVEPRAPRARRAKEPLYRWNRPR